MAGHHGSHTAQIGDDKTVVFPFVLQDIGEQPAVDIVRRAIDCVVTGHQRLRPALDHGIAEMRQPVVAQHRLGNHRVERLAAGLHIVHGIMF